MTAAAGPAALDVTQQQSVHTQHLSSTRSLPDCQGQRQRQELVLPVARSAAEASHSARRWRSSISHLHEGDYVSELFHFAC